MKTIKIENLKNVITEKEEIANVKCIIEFCRIAHNTTKKWHRLKGNRIKFHQPFVVEWVDLSDNELTLFKKLWKDAKSK